VKEVVLMDERMGRLMVFVMGMKMVGMKVDEKALFEDGLMAVWLVEKKGVKD
jgi:hypothetical protein